MTSELKRHQQYWEDKYAEKGLMWGTKIDEQIQKAMDLIPSASKILDAGCGSGRHSIFLAKKGFFVSGVDISTTAIDIAQKWANQEGIKNATFHTSNLCELPYPNDAFDAVICPDVLNFMPAEERTAALNHITRILKENGLLILELFSTEDGSYGGGKEVEPNTFERKTGLLNHLYSKEEVEQILSDFEILSIDHDSFIDDVHTHPHVHGVWTIVAKKQPFPKALIKN